MAREYTLAAPIEQGEHWWDISPLEGGKSDNNFKMN